MALNKESSISLGLPEVPISQNLELFTELKRVYNACNALARAVDLYTGALGEIDEFKSQANITRLFEGKNGKIYLQCGEPITYGQTVGIKADGKAWLAKSAVLLARGFCTSSGTTATGDYIEVQCRGLYPEYPSATLTPGLTYFQSATFGVIGGAGAQAVGFAISTTHLYFSPNLS